MKAYVKPQLQVEYFTLSQNIARACSVPGGGTTLGKPTWGDEGTCGWDIGIGDGDIILWTESSVGCNEHLGEKDQYEFLCYNNPNGGCTIFSS